MIITQELLIDNGWFFNQVKQMYELNIYPDSIYLEREEHEVSDSWIITLYPRNKSLQPEPFTVNGIYVNTMKDIMIVIYNLGMIRKSAELENCRKSHA